MVPNGDASIQTTQFSTTRRRVRARPIYSGPHQDGHPLNGRLSGSDAWIREHRELNVQYFSIIECITNPVTNPVTNSATNPVTNSVTNSILI